MKIQKAIKKYGKDLLTEYNAVAVGRGVKVRGGRSTGVESIVFSVKEKKHLLDVSQSFRIPSEIKGHLTDVVESGVISVLPPVAIEDHKKRHRPAMGGVSVGHIDITCGTIGCLVRRDGKIYILSNNHVLSCSNNATLGDIILQPGVYDGGTNPEDVIAELTEFVPITFSGGVLPPTECPVGNGSAAVLNALAWLFGRSTRLYATGDTDNYVDAAIALPDPEDISPEILEVGIPKGARVAELGDTLIKSGRTTGLTTGKVDQVDVTVQVRYGENKGAVFVDQLMAGAMSQGGDSGSAVLDSSNNVVGLLFAGSETTTIINRFENVIKLLELDGVV